MTDLGTVVRRFRGILSREPEQEASSPGIDTVLDGISAVTVISSLTGTVPAEADGDASDVRGELTSAIGRSMAGMRADVVLSGPDLSGTQDLIHLAAGRQLSLVAHVACRALPGHATAQGSGHEAIHTAADSGFFTLFARNVQEAVDLSLIARYVAERTLVPGLVAMDGATAVRAVEDVNLPTATLVREFLGRAGDMIESPTPAQEIVFGANRRRVPRWFDLERPALHGAHEAADIWGLGAAARRPYVLDHVAPTLAAAVAEYARHSG
ncbi:MAG: hypothetical protein ACYTGV_20245, partial [Planctomycetota bacterium]